MVAVVFSSFFFAEFTGVLRTEDRGHFTMNERAVFVAALQVHNAVERSAFLDKECGGDSQLREQLERLLREHDQLGSFLEMPVAASIASRTAEPVIMECLGTTIGPYKLIEQIGEGGFGVVFMAEQQQPVRRKVALKVIKPGMDTRQVIARFEAERQALALMDHPNIAKIFDAGATESGRPYFVMELIKGPPITDYCDQERLTPGQRLQLFIVVCQAVQHAHQKGIIHRDIKPTNILVTIHDGAPAVKIIDFGIAKATGRQLTEKTLFTNFPQMIGSPVYMSPEQAGLNSVDIDTRSDIYSLGVLLYELLTGTTPFDKERLRQAGYDEMRRVIREEEPLMPSTRVSTFDQASTIISARSQSGPKRLGQLYRGDLDWIVMRALEKDRNRRYETASAFATDVQQHLHDEPVAARPPSRLYRLGKFARRYKTGVASAFLLILTIILGSTVSVWKYLDERTARIEADDMRTLAEKNASDAKDQTAKALAAQQEADHQRNSVSQNLYFADMRLGLADWSSGNLARLSSMLQGHVPTQGAPDFRSWEWYYLLSLCHQDEKTLITPFTHVTAVAWSPDRRYLAASVIYATMVWDTISWRLLRRFPYGRSAVAWSRDGKRLAWGPAANNGAPVCIWNAETDTFQTFHGHTGSIWTVAWSPDGKRLASAGMDKEIRIWDAQTGSCARVMKPVRANVSWLKWHPSGTILASTGMDGEPLNIWDVESGRILPTGLSPGYVTCMDWSPDGSTLALGASGQCILYKTADWSKIKSWQAHPSELNSLAWNGDGSRLASAGSEGVVKVWVPHSATCVATLHGHFNLVKSVTWEPGGHRLASGSADGSVRVWPIPFRAEPRRFEVAHAGRAPSFIWGDAPNTLRTFDAANGLCGRCNVVTCERFEETEVSPATWGCFSADGRFLAVGRPDKQLPGLVVYDARSGKLTQTVDAPVPRVGSFSPDSSRLALLKNQSIDVADLRRNEVCFHWEGIRVPCAAAWSPDGRLLAVAGTAQAIDRSGTEWSPWVHIFDIDKHERLWQLGLGKSDGGMATAVTWNPNGLTLASGDERGRVVVWDRSTGRYLAQVHLHTGKITALAWSPDGRRIASASDDRTIRIWDPTTGVELLRFDVPETVVMQLDWSANDQCLAGACANGAVLIWDASAGYEYVHGGQFATEAVYARQREAQELFGIGRASDAIAILEKALACYQSEVGSRKAAREYLVSANICWTRKSYAAAARYFSEAVAADPGLANGASAFSSLYEYACFETSAGCQPSGGGNSLVAKEHGDMRADGLKHLQGVMTAWHAMLALNNKTTNALIQGIMKRWLMEPRLSGLRDPDALAKLPDAERLGWEKLWKEVAELERLAAASQPR